MWSSSFAIVEVNVLSEGISIRETDRKVSVHIGNVVADALCDPCSGKEGPQLAIRFRWYAVERFAEVISDAIQQVSGEQAAFCQDAER